MVAAESRDSAVCRQAATDGHSDVTVQPSRELLAHLEGGVDGEI
jgi:hypothetical protein